MVNLLKKKNIDFIYFVSRCTTTVQFDSSQSVLFYSHRKVFYTYYTVHATWRTLKSLYKNIMY